MDEPSVMATENALMAAALTQGPTTIANAACEPHVQDLARLLVKMGAEIDGIGSNVMTVHGRDKLGGAEHRICPDHIEVASFMALAAATKGELRVRDTEPEDLVMIRRQFRRLGLESMVEGNDVLVPPEQVLRSGPTSATRPRRSRMARGPRSPPTSPRSRSPSPPRPRQVLIFEKMFENRLFFVDKLVAMGARITLCDPHRAIVYGPSRLHGERVDSPDIRAGMAMLIAALAADGTSEIGNIVQIDRGYERIDLRLRELGARIERVSASRSLHSGRCERPPRPAQPTLCAHRQPIPSHRMTHRIPPGTRDILPDEMRELRRLQGALADAFERFGYGEVATPTIEYHDVLARGDERGAPAAYRFFDEDGELLAMRSDMTIPIARLVATRFAGAEPPFRLLLHRERLPRGPPSARADARVHPGGRGADRRRRARRHGRGGRGPQRGVDVPLPLRPRSRPPPPGQQLASNPSSVRQFASKPSGTRPAFRAP